MLPIYWIIYRVFRGMFIPIQPSRKYCQIFSCPVNRLSSTSLLLPAQTDTLPSVNVIRNSLHLWMTTTGPRSLWNAIKVSSSLIRGQIRDLASISRYNVARGKPCYLLAYGFKVWNFLYNLQQYDSFRWNEKRKPTSKKWHFKEVGKIEMD